MELFINASRSVSVSSGWIALYKDARFGLCDFIKGYSEITKRLEWTVGSSEVTNLPFDSESVLYISKCDSLCFMLLNERDDGVRIKDKPCTGFIKILCEKSKYKSRNENLHQFVI